MTRFTFSRRAQEHFEAILYGIAEHAGWEHSMRVEEKMYAAFRFLAENPGAGRKRADLSLPEVFSWLEDPYQIFYRREPSQVRIVAIYHGRRDIQRLIEEDFIS